MTSSSPTFTFTQIASTASTPANLPHPGLGPASQALRAAIAAIVNNRVKTEGQTSIVMSGPKGNSQIIIPAHGIAIQPAPKGRATAQMRPGNVA